VIPRLTSRAVACAGRRLAAVVLAVALAASCAARSGQDSSASSTSSSSAPDLKADGSYSIGVMLGAQLHQIGLDEHSVAFDKVLQGLKDVTSGKAQPSVKDRENIQALIVRVRAAAAETNQAAARKFLADNGKLQGVTTTPSGLQYKVVNEGSGSPPGPTDQVLVNYRGTLLDGTEFDSSYKRGQPASLQVNRVIPGWREALVLMKPGAKWQLFIPPQLAYGNDSPPAIPPGSLLKFDVELLSVKPGAALPGGAVPHTGAGAGR
jgi:FKBP-type peptidyl-prolyl cis-trans isomerase